MKKKKLKKRSSVKKNVLYIFVGIVVLFIAFLCYQFYTCFLPNFRVNAGHAYLYIDKTMTFDDVVAQLESKNLIRNKNSFSRWAKIKRYPEHIKTGRYEVLDKCSNRDLINRLSRKIQSPVRLKLNNIRTKEQLCGRLSEQLMLDSAEMMHVLTDPKILKKYDVTADEIIAFFIPNTYEVYWDVSAENILNRMYSEYKRFWNKERREKADMAGLTPMQTCILASIVEEETNIKKDMPIIAGLYLNRLRIGMPMQACPTARFAVGDFTLTRILDEHISIDSPYNTYRHKGLPPGPIRIASPESIEAVLNYEKSNYLYMCAKETMNGEHYFSRTLSEHNRHAQKYQRAYNQLYKQKKQIK